MNKLVVATLVSAVSSIAVAQQTTEQKRFHLMKRWPPCDAMGGSET